MLRQETAALLVFLEELGKLDEVKKAKGGKEWTKYADTEEERVYYKQEAETKLHYTYMETYVKAPLIDVIAVLSNVE